MSSVKFISPVFISRSFFVTGFLLATGCSQSSNSMNVPSPQFGPVAKSTLIGTGVGGGLGLIIGSTSGNAGEGLLIGSAAGAAVGLGIGSQLKSSDTAAATPAEENEPLIREEDEFEQNRKELKDIRKQTRDAKKQKTKTPSQSGVVWLNQPSRARNPKRTPTQVAKREVPAPDSRGRLGYVKSDADDTASGPISFSHVKKSPAPTDAAAAKVAKATPPLAAQKATPSSGLPPAATVAAEPLALDATKSKADAPLAEAKTSTASALAPKDATSCAEAQKEAQRGVRASSDADRLFYLRRAARLCPTEANYHAELGKLYSSIGKTEDAKYEFRQAIDLQPHHQMARDELSILENAGNIVQ